MSVTDSKVEDYWGSDLRGNNFLYKEPTCLESFVQGVI